MARDEAAEAAARTADYSAHAPESIQPPALDREAWVEFLAVFLEGFPELHLEVLDSSADEVMVAQRIPFTGMHTRTFRGVTATGNNVRFAGLEIKRMVNGRAALRNSALLHSTTSAALSARRSSPPAPVRTTPFVCRAAPESTSSLTTKGSPDSAALLAESSAGLCGGVV
ncbi:MAG TPA: ester cyclase [Solirubrobacteraceae bacterium]|nr:ester cyclase [Solirubrobacteraceae bacterium]